MGRHFKTIITAEGIDRRATGYYSSPDVICRYLAKELHRLNPEGRIVLDPCVGKEELVGYFFDAGLRVDSFDTQRYLCRYRSNFKQLDFLRFFAEHVRQDSGPLPYDFYIANPPYNCHETVYIRENKQWLESLFEDIGVLNMYSMFLYSMIELAKPGALIGVLVCDSFLNNVLYAWFREKILDTCTLREIILCPTDLFWNQKADVRTCIAILEKGKSPKPASVLTADRVPSGAEFETLLATRRFELKAVEDILLTGKADSREIVVGCDPEVKSFFSGERLKDHFRCLTGISTGNDRRYLARTRSEAFCFPFYKNPGSHRFYSQPNAYLTRDFEKVARNVPNFIVRNKDVLFKPGITCSSMGIPFSACYLPEGSTFGVNPTVICDNPKDIWWLMAYLNSSFVTYIVRSVILRSNMITSGYVNRIPLVAFTDRTKRVLEQLAGTAYAAVRAKDAAELSRVMSEIDEVVFRATDLSDSARATVNKFCSNILRYT